MGEYTLQALGAEGAGSCMDGWKMWLYLLNQIYLSQTTLTTRPWLLIRGRRSCRLRRGHLWASVGSSCPSIPEILPPYILCRGFIQDRDLLLNNAHLRVTSPAPCVLQLLAPPISHDTNYNLYSRSQKGQSLSLRQRLAWSRAQTWRVSR